MEIVLIGTTVSRGYVAFVIPSQGDAQRAEHASEGIISIIRGNFYHRATESTEFFLFFLRVLCGEKNR